MPLSRERRRKLRSETAPTDGWRLDDAGLLFVEAHVRKHIDGIEPTVLVAAAGLAGATVIGR